MMVPIDITRSIIWYVARHRTSFLEWTGVDVVADMVNEEFLSERPEQHLEGVISNAKKLGRKFGLTVKVEFFGDPYFIRNFPHQ